jgi:glutaminyl-tRNA synthetase
METTNFIHDIIDEEIRQGKIKQVITRFPPEPNGYLHIGHAKSIVLNFETAKKYGGRCNLRFDDTNPAKEDTEYIESIKEDVMWLGYRWNELHYASDYFDRLYELAVKLIMQGDAYICDLSAEEIRQSRGTLTEGGINSPYRERSVEENLKLFEQMRDGKFKEGERVLRAKIDMSSPNINMRDPVLYRIMYKSHHNTGDKWCIYPTYDFTHPLSDAIEGITHSICTLEFEDHRPLYNWINEKCGFADGPRQIEFARLNIANTVMSKRFLKKLVDEGQVDGWDDPRMPTICAIRKKGYPPEAVRDFCMRIGVAKANSEVEEGYLEHCVRENLNASCERAMAVLNPLKVIIKNYPQDKSETVNFDIKPQTENGGTRGIEFCGEIYIEADDFSLNPPPKYYRLTKGGMARLKGAYIIKCNDVITDAAGNPQCLICEYFPDSKSGEDKSGIKVKGVLHWVNAKTSKQAEIILYDSLLSPDGGGELTVNPASKTVYGNARVEPYLYDSKDRTRYQFLRTGYFIKDGGRFLEIVKLKDSYNK